MKHLYIYSLLITAFTSRTVVCQLPPAPKDKGDPIKAIQGLVGRVLGDDWVARFSYENITQSSDGMDVFEVGTDNKVSKPIFRGNNGVALALAFNYYLKYYCNCSVSWGRDGTGGQLNMPNPLPLPSKDVRVELPLKYRCICYCNYIANGDNFLGSIVW